MAKLSEYYSDAVPISSSLWAMLDDGAKAHMDDIAVTVMHQPADYLAHFKPESSKRKDDKCLQWTFADLRHAALLTAASFQRQGVRRGTTMTTLINNGIECVVLLWVSTILQLTLAPLVPQLLDDGREEQLRDYMRRLQPDVLVVLDEKGAKKIDEATKAEGVNTTLKVSLAKPGGDGWHEFSGVVPIDIKASDPDSTSLAQDPAIDRNGERVAGIYFTSGTSTGKPKGCPRRVRNQLSSTSGLFGMPDVPDRGIIHTPNSGAICQAFLHGFGSSGRHTIFPGPSFSPPKALDAIEQFDAQLMVAIPVMSRMFEKEMAERKRDLSALKYVALGGDMVTIDAKRKFEALFPGAQVTVGHGMTEGTSMIGWKGHGFPSPFPQFHGMLGTGYPQPGTLIRICDQEGKVLPRGEAGELHLGGYNVIDHYLDTAQPEAFYRDEKGSWMLTGDRAFMDDDGLIFIIGRSKDIIKRVGLALSPAVVESVLNAIDGVEASAIGAPHVDYGEVPVAIVKESNAVADSDRIKKVVTDSLGTDYALHDLVALADIGLDAWPLNQTGKVAKHELKTAYLSKYGSQVI